MDSCDVLVIGLGHAGLAAAVEASRNGAKVIAVDDNPAPGGQISRAKLGELARHVDMAVQSLAAKGVEVLLSSSVYDISAGVALVIASGQRRSVRFEKAILATGSRELFLPFPGWTLPGVMGAGGLQALVKGGLNVGGKRVVVAGSGPLLLPVADYLKKAGAKVYGPVEQAPMAKLAAFSIAALRAGKVGEMSAYRDTLLRYKFGTWIEACNGADRAESVRLNNGRLIECDYVACSFGLVPNVELASLLSCELEGGFVKVGSDQMTTVGGIYCAGEPTGIGGHDLASLEGVIAGTEASGKKAPEALMTDVRKRRVFADAIGRAFAVRSEVKLLATADTVVCRCEDVRLGQLQTFRSMRDAKLQTRCGMGPCQGRICGAALEAVKGWAPERSRSPITPVPMSCLASSQEDL